MQRFSNNAWSRAAVVSVLVLTVFAAEAFTQVRPVYDRGAAGLTQLLNRLNANKSALMIGAHPDDEDTALLAYLARGENARTAYLSLTRGDGGQNIIGPELGEALGIIRTEELLQARTLDGAEQYFTRAYDYGFSKTLTEAKSKWDEKVILCDVVKVIRDFRPLVVISQFSGTSADGHGQHQFAGYISPLAVKAAADRAVCDDAGEPWAVKKFYVRHRGQGESTLRVNTGKYDPLLGRSYFEIAMEARSQHKSQEQGVLELRGDQFSSLNLQGSEPKETSIFAGLNLGEPVRRYRLGDPALLRRLTGAYGTSDRKREIAEAIAGLAGLRIDALADSETIVAGEPMLVGVKAYAADTSVKVRNVVVNVPHLWSVAPAQAQTSNSPANVLREAAPFASFFRVTAPDSQWSTAPYWLRAPRKGDMFVWDSAGDAETMPFEKRPLTAKVTVEVGGVEIAYERDVQYRFADDIRGEVRRNVDLVPRLNVQMDQSLVLVPVSQETQTKRVTMTVTNLSSRPTSGRPSLFLGSDKLNGKAVTSEFALKRPGEKTTLAWDITIAGNTPPGRYPIIGEARFGDRFFTNTMRTISYPHIRTHRYYVPNGLDFLVIDLKTTPRKIGYVEGSGDQVFEAIKQMGFDVETISETELAGGNLRRFDTIVIGIRAYQVRPDVVANNDRLLEFARQGGTLVVQYQLPSYAQQKLMPYAAEMGPRTADENAPVRIIDPAHPLISGPNQITDADFAGWVQERNLYNFNKFGPEYTGILETHDPGETENSGGLVVANVGKGKYVYCSFSMFRQLPAGVSGAYRLLANILSYSAGERQN